MACSPVLVGLIRLADRDMFMRFRGGGVGHLYMRLVEPWLDATGWGATWPSLGNSEPASTRPAPPPQGKQANRNTESNNSDTESEDSEDGDSEDGDGEDADGEDLEQPEDDEDLDEDEEGGDNPIGRNHGDGEGSAGEDEAEYSTGDAGL